MDEESMQGDELGALLLARGKTNTGVSECICMRPSIGA
jgi:hypothetical protein